MFKFWSVAMFVIGVICLCISLFTVRDRLENDFKRTDFKVIIVNFLKKYNVPDSHTWILAEELSKSLFSYNGSITFVEADNYKH